MSSIFHRVSEPCDAGSTQGDKWALGAILVDFGCLTWPDVKTILNEQARTSELFGQAALRLRLVRKPDLDKAIARQFRVSSIEAEPGALGPELIVASDPSSLEVAAFRRLRAELLHRYFAEDTMKKTLAIASPGRGEGKSYAAANLAASYAELGKRILLVDADMRTGRQHEIFGMKNMAGLSTILSGRAGAKAIQHIGTAGRLAVLTCGPTPPSPEALVCQMTFKSFIDDVCKDYDIVLIDTPASCVGSDFQGVVAATGGTLVVAHRNHTRAAAMEALVESVRVARGTVIGVVMNWHAGGEAAARPRVGPHDAVS